MIIRHFVTEHQAQRLPLLGLGQFNTESLSIENDMRPLGPAGSDHENRENER